MTLQFHRTHHLSILVIGERPPESERGQIHSCSPYSSCRSQHSSFLAKLHPHSHTLLSLHRFCRCRDQPSGNLDVKASLDFLDEVNGLLNGGLLHHHLGHPANNSISDPLYSTPSTLLGPAHLNTLHAIPAILASRCRTPTYLSWQSCWISATCCYNLCKREQGGKQGDEQS